MKKKTFAALLVANLVGFATGIVCATSALATPSEHSPFHIISQLGRVLVLIENEYVDVVERGRLIEGAIEGMVQELDPHSSYLAPADFANFKSDTEGEFGGVGVEVDFSNDAVTVIAPIEGSPAARAGIESGDQIVSIDRKPVRGKSMDELVKWMRGAPDTPVSVSVRRQGHEALLHFTLVREVIEVSSVAHKRLDRDVVYLRIKQYQRGTHVELLEAMGELAAAAPAAVAGAILDLRNNPGGLVTEAVAVADEFLDGGLIYSTRRRGAIVDEVTASSGGVLQGVPVVVLVNEFSASAAELVAGALQDNGRAEIIGNVTFGKGSVQSIIDLPFGAGLRLTTLRYYTPAGHAIQAQGIQPDVVLPATSVGDASRQVLREADLENHLPAEMQKAPPVVAPSPTPPPEEVTDERPGISPTHLGVARVVPEDPSGGPDRALAVAYERLLAKLVAPH